MKFITYFLFSLFSTALIYSQQLAVYKNTYFSGQRILLSQEDILTLTSETEQKILSGELIQSISEKNYLLERSLITFQEAKEQIVIYVDEYPTAEQINSLTNLNVNCLLEVWTPPLKNHPYGFFLAELPVEKFTEALSLSFIKKMDTAEYEKYPNNNYGVISINADDVWSMGYDGTGVKVGILDSGIDTYYDGTEFPSSFERMDYSAYPTIDVGVENTVTGHGTHVAGTVLARGINSVGRTDEGNGFTPFRGAAPDANLTFLKIGSDASGSASDAAMIAAMDAAVNIYNVDVLSMSYGGWNPHHDGSSALEQKVDWVYSQGVPFFISAGNEGNSGRHYSGTVNANSESGFIQINVTGAGLNNTALYFNLVWVDGINRNNLTLKFYNSSQTELTAVTRLTTTESSRGTESHYSYYNSYTPIGNSTYYVKVVNPSNVNQPFQIYDVWGVRVSFQNADPFYTIGSPASADYGFGVGSYVTRVSWTASDGSGPWSYTGSYTLNDIAPYSSRGPRIDGYQKPNITAPGHSIISIRDTDVLTSLNSFWIDNDGITGSGSANYYVMTGTSMACPITAGSAALLLDFEPSASPQLIYDAIQNSANTSGTGTVPNNTWGYGKLDVLAATNEPLPVELSLFTAKVLKSGGIKLDWRTETEVNNYGFEVERLKDYKIEKLQDLPDGETGWEKLGFVEGNGNSNSPKNYSFTDNAAGYGKYSYRLKQIDTDGQFEYSKVIEVDAGTIPNEIVLEQNYPNPFNPSTKIKFALAETQSAKLVVYDALGNEVATPFIGIAEGGKLYEAEFHGENLSSGIYFYRLVTESKIENRKMLLVK